MAPVALGVSTCCYAELMNDTFRLYSAPESDRATHRNGSLASPPKKTSSFGFIKKRLSLGSSGSSP